VARIFRGGSSFFSIKSKAYLVLSVVSLAFLFTATDAMAEVIRNFDVSIKANNDSSVDVIESIQYDFENQYKHGIFRVIPVQYSRSGGNYTVDFRLVDVTDGDDHKLKTSISRQGRDINIRIGDPSVTVTGRKQYNIHYVVRRAINFFDKAPEFYWNVTGHEWPVVIEHATARVFPPINVRPSEVKHKSYAGGYQTNNVPSASKLHGNGIEYTAGPLKPGQDFTIVAGFPKDSMVEPPPFQELVWILVDWWPALGMPLLTLFGLGAMWWHYGRDAVNPGAIPVEWDPPTGMRPAEVGTLVDERCDMQDIVATLIDLAARGHLKIKQLKRKDFWGFDDPAYEFTKTASSEPEHKLTNYEEKFLDGIFGPEPPVGVNVQLSDLRYRFYTRIPRIRENIYSRMETDGYFMQNPETVRQSYHAIGLLIAFLSFFVIIGGICGNGFLPIGLGMIFSAAVIGVMAFVMPARTERGCIALRQCLGFARFIEKAEKRRIEVLAKEDPTIFGRLLPYAMVLGCADRWASQFQDLMEEPPEWFQPYGYNSVDYIFSPQLFVNDLGYGMRSMESTMLAAPVATSDSGVGTSSAWGGDSGFGGGFSGGGFGGGGGGSW